MAFSRKRKFTKIKVAGELPSRREMDLRLIALWQEIVKLRANYRCEYCSNTDRLQAHHIFSKSNWPTRWDPANGVALCSGHHAFFAHKDPERFRRWLIEQRGEPAYDTLYIKAHSISRFRAGDLLLLERLLNDDLADLRASRRPKGADDDE